MRKAVPISRFAALGLLVCLAACSGGPEKARAEIEKRGIPFEPVGMETAVGSGDHELVRLFLAAGYDPNTFEDSQRSPLSLAVSRMNSEATEMLIEAGASAAGIPGILTIPITRNDATMIEHLLAAGADVDAVDRNGRTPLLIALVQNNTEVVELLIERGADPDNAQGRDLKRVVPLIEAVRLGRSKMVGVLLDGGATVDRPGGLPRITALMLAAKNGETETVELLLSRGADPTLEVRGKTAIREAQRAGHTELAARLSGTVSD